MPTTSDHTVYEVTGKGPAVILIHGLGLTRNVWQWMVPALKDYQVITYDLTGHGETTAPSSPPSLETLSAQVIALMDEIGVEQASLIGFSLGGMIVRHAARTYPTRVTSIGILNSPHLRAPELQENVRMRMQTAIMGGPASTVQNALDRWYTAGFLDANPEMRDLVKGWVMGNDPAIYPQMYRVLVEDVHLAVGPVAQPTLILTAEEDFGNGPDMAQAIQGDIPHAQCVIVPRLRHMTLTEDPNAVNAPVRAFLDQIHK